jgi:hypothetical protein
MSDLIQAVNSPEEIARAAVRLRVLALNIDLSSSMVLELFERWAVALEGNGIESFSGSG